jgi:hypothetical protein
MAFFMVTIVETSNPEKEWHLKNAVLWGMTPCGSCTNRRHLRMKRMSEHLSVQIHLPNASMLKLGDLPQPEWMEPIEPQGAQ